MREESGGCPVRVRAGQAGRCRGGFSLVEMLVVMGVMAVLWAVAVPAVSGILSGHRLATAAAELSGMVGRGVDHARSQNTYVWLRVGAKEEGVTVEGYYSRDGMGDVSGGSNLVSGWERGSLEGVELAVIGGGISFEEEREEAEVVVGEEGGWLVVTPRGEVKFVEGGAGEVPALPEGAVRWLEMGLKNIGGSAEDVAVVQVAGMTGQRVVYQR